MLLYVCQKDCTVGCSPTLTPALTTCFLILEASFRLYALDHTLTCFDGLFFMGVLAIYTGLLSFYLFFLALLMAR